jgi:hypothetical protein
VRSGSVGWLVRGVVSLGRFVRPNVQAALKIISGGRLRGGDYRFWRVKKTKPDATTAAITVTGIEPVAA